ncbi:MAG: hypothetical protein Q8M26_17670 [Pseudolabrys sp.]|nr:hypothetical protein [Pseudolabrys sp.]
MKKPVRIFAAAVTIAIFSLAPEANAQQRVQPAPYYAVPVSLVPDRAFFAGLGGAFQGVNFGTQDVYFKGTADVYTGGALTSSGSADGTGYLPMANRAVAAFSLQGGYFSRIPDSEWLWGAKFSYSYLGGTTVSVRNALVPQAGSTTPTGTTDVIPFTGNVATRSYEVQLTHQMAFVPFIGRTFDTNSFIYLGAGPTLSQIKTDLIETIGFAFGDGRPTDISGMPTSYSASNWVYGGMVVVGISHFITPTLFLDFSYSYAITRNQTGSFGGPFVNNRGVGGSTGNGTLVGTNTGNAVTQGITLTVNKTF